MGTAESVASHREAHAAGDESRPRGLRTAEHAAGKSRRVPRCARPRGRKQLDGASRGGCFEPACLTPLDGYPESFPPRTSRNIATSAAMAVWSAGSMSGAKREE